VLRAQWPEVLDAVKRERRVAWMILSNASVHSLADGVLTLRFSRDGDLKGFSTSGCDADLKRVLSTGFGLNVGVHGISGADAPPSLPNAASVPDAASPASTPDPAEPPRRRDPTPQVAGPPPADAYEPDEPDDAGPPPGPPELTGMDLIQRELGGQIIREIDA
jgi:DNA polymerase-3 subunit gamma/tau